MRTFVDQHRDAHGVEPICRVLQIAPSDYRRHAARQRTPALRSQRAQRDEALMPHIERVWRANLQVYGVKKVWRQLHREGHAVARCTVERLMRRQGLRGVIRGKVVRSRVSDPKAPCPLDKVNPQFKADRSNQLWVSDLTQVSTWTRSLSPQRFSSRWVHRTLTLRPRFCGHAGDRQGSRFDELGETNVGA